jgi:hypothetical protein
MCADSQETISHGSSPIEVRGSDLQVRQQNGSAKADPFALPHPQHVVPDLNFTVATPR